MFLNFWSAVATIGSKVTTQSEDYISLRHTVQYISHEAATGVVPYGLKSKPKLYIPSTLNHDYLLWHTQLIVCAVKY